MRKILFLAALLLFVSTAVAGHEDKWTAKPAPKPIQHRFWIGANFNPEGVGPQMDYEIRWGDRWGIKVGLGMYRVQDVGCAGGALFCPALHGTPASDIFGRHWYKPRAATSPGVTYHTETDAGGTVMFSWTKRQRR